MKITQIGKQHRFVGTVSNSLGLGGITIASNSTLPVIPGYVWTAQSSNTASWVPNVNAITANSSNTLQSPIVNFESGTGVTFAVASNTITIAAGDTVTAATISALGFVGLIVISDTPSTPLVFADLIQNDDEDDLVYVDL